MMMSKRNIEITKNRSNKHTQLCLNFTIKQIPLLKDLKAVWNDVLLRSYIRFLSLLIHNKQVESSEIIY